MRWTGSGTTKTKVASWMKERKPLTAGRTTPSRSQSPLKFAECAFEFTRQKKQSAYQRDNDRWEENRLKTSGVVRVGDLEDDDDEDASRVHLVVHDVKPPFLVALLIRA